MTNNRYRFAGIVGFAGKRLIRSVNRAVYCKIIPVFRFKNKYLLNLTAGIIFYMQKMYIPFVHNSRQDFFMIVDKDQLPGLSNYSSRFVRRGRVLCFK